MVDICSVLVLACRGGRDISPPFGGSSSKVLAALVAPSPNNKTTVVLQAQ